MWLPLFARMSRSVRVRFSVFLTNAWAPRVNTHIFVVALLRLCAVCEGPAAVLNFWHRFSTLFFACL